MTVITGRNGRFALAQRGWDRDFGPRTTLAVIAVVFALLVTLVALKTPAWEAPDEPGHAQNVETLVAGHWYRMPLNSAWARAHAADLGNELHQPPLYYLLLAGLQRLVGRPPQAISPGPTVFPWVTNGVYRHHSAAQHRFVLLLRLPNLFLGLIGLFFTFLCARLIVPDKWTPVVAAATVALVPRLVFLSASVTNDNLVTALGAALAYSSVRYAMSEQLVWGSAVGIILGLLTITKLSALPAYGVLVPMLLGSKGWRQCIRLGAYTAASALLVCGWWLVQNQVRYGDPLAANASHNYLVAIHGLGSVAGSYAVTNPLHLIFYDVPSRIWQQFWYSSGGLNQFYWRWPINLTFWLALGSALFGLGGARGFLHRAEEPQRRAVVILVVLVLLGLLAVWITAFSTEAYTPRLAFFGLPALACLAALGIGRWSVPTRFLLPALCLCGTLVAIDQNVLSIHWGH